jgi:SET domain-containing protein
VIVDFLKSIYHINNRTRTKNLTVNNIQQGMFMKHPDTEIRFVNDTIGVGLFATKFIPKGTITWAQDAMDRQIHIDAHEAEEPVIDHIMKRYLFEKEEGIYILCWDEARYYNHSCGSNNYSIDDFTVAVRDIYPGEELTDDYGYYLPQWQPTLTCCCNHPECRKEISCLDKKEPFIRQKTARLHAEVKPLMPTVPQPLLDIIPILNRYTTRIESSERAIHI